MPVTVVVPTGSAGVTVAIPSGTAGPTEQVRGDALRDLSNVTDADFLAKATAAGVGADVPETIVDPHLFGAVGDAVGAGDGTVTGGTLLESGQYTFTAADVGKKVYLQLNGEEERTIASISAGKAVLATSASNGSGYWLAGTDDTAAFDLAFAHAAANFAGVVGASEGTQPATYVRGPIPVGGVVRARAGRGYLVGCTQAQYNAGRPGALVVPRRVELSGSGAGFANTVFHLKPGSYGNGVCNEGYGDDAYSDFITLANFTLNCYGSDWSPNSGRGVALHVAFDGYGKTDPFNRVLHVCVNNSRKEGFLFTGRGELYALDILAAYSREWGINFEGLTDTRCDSPTSIGCDWAGLRVYGGGPIQIKGGKSFYSGAGGGNDHKKSANVVLDTDNGYTGVTKLSGFEAQESRGSSLWLGSGRNIIDGFQAFDPGRSALGGGSLPDVIAGIHLSGPNCNNNVINGVVRPTVTNFGEVGANWGNAGNAVHIDAFDGVVGGPQKNFGEIYTTQATTTPSLRGIEYTGGFGAKGGAGTSNGKNTGLKVDGVACT